MPNSRMSAMGIAVADLGLGDMLQQQTQSQIDEEERKRRMGISTLGGNPMNFGMTGVASTDLGMIGARGR